MKQKYLITETMMGTIALYMVLKKLIEPFNKWDAYKAGIIDKNGKKLKHPVSAKEIKSWDMLTKFVWNFKKLLSKFVGRTKLASYLTAAYLLKDSISPVYFEIHKDVLNNTLLEDFSYKQQLELFTLLNTIEFKDTITEDNFEYYLNLYLPKVEKFLSEGSSLNDTI